MEDMLSQQMRLTAFGLLRKKKLKAKSKKNPNDNRNAEARPRNETV